MVDPTDRLLVCCSDGAILSPVFGVVKEVGLWHGGINGDLLVAHVSYVLLNNIYSHHFSTYDVTALLVMKPSIVFSAH